MSGIQRFASGIFAIGIFARGVFPGSSAVNHQGIYLAGPGAVLTLWFCLLSPPAMAETASDVAKEQRWAEQVTDTLFDGEPLWLSADGHKFLGIAMDAANGETENGLLVIHGMGVHPNWDQVVRPLRVGMSEAGWQTLSIQMPVLPNEATAMDYLPLFQEVDGRIDAAVAALQTGGASNIVVIAHSMGAAMANHYQADHPDSPVRALVLIGMNADTREMPVDSAQDLRRITVPVLDLYGSDDLSGVIASAPRRASAAYTGGNKAYQQVKVSGANHFFDGFEQQLLEQVTSWLAMLAE